MSNVRRVNGGKTNAHAKTLADVKREALKKAKKEAKANKAFALSMQADITNELKQIKTQQQLTNIQEMVHTYGSSKNRAEFDKLQSTFRKEARALIDIELATMKSKEQLESIRSMVELNGSQAQKAKFAEFESYYAKPTWAKYANIHGTTYTAPTSGVGEADRRAEQIISNNNLKQMEEEARKADKAAKQVNRALAASARMDEFLAEGDKLIAQGKEVKTEKPKRLTWAEYAKQHGTTYNPPTSGVAEADRRAEQIISNNNLKQMEEEARKADKAARQTNRALAASARMDEFLAEGDKLIAQGKQIGSSSSEPGVKIIGRKDIGRLRPSEPAEAVEIIEEGAKGEKAARNFGNVTKFLKKGALGLLGLGAIALVYYGLKKCNNAGEKATNIQPVPTGATNDSANKAKPAIVTNPTDTTKTATDSTQTTIPVPVDTTATDSVAKIVPIEINKTASDKEETDKNKDENKTNVAKKQKLEKYVPKKGEYWASILKARYNTDNATALAMSHKIKDMIYDDSLAAKQAPVMFLPKVWNFNGKTYYYNDDAKAKTSATTGNVKTEMGKMSPDLIYN